MTEGDVVKFHSTPESNLIMLSCPTARLAASVCSAAVGSLSDVVWMSKMLSLRRRRRVTNDTSLLFWDIPTMKDLTVTAKAKLDRRLVKSSIRGLKAHPSGGRSTGKASSASAMVESV